MTENVQEPLNVPEIYRAKLTSVLKEFSKLTPTDGLLPEVNKATLKIRLRDDFVVNRNPYRLATNERQAVREIVQELLMKNIIRESESPFASPIILVKKRRAVPNVCRLQGT